VLFFFSEIEREMLNEGKLLIINYDLAFYFNFYCKFIININITIEKKNECNMTQEKKKCVFIYIKKRQRLLRYQHEIKNAHSLNSNLEQKLN
jgi:hypothetical protein